MSDHYFTSSPGSEHKEQIITAEIAGLTLQFKTDRGVFSRNQVDYGSKVLIETFIDQADIPTNAEIIELGSGYGPIVLTLAKHYLNAKLLGVEINERALALAEVNAQLNNVSNVIWQLCDATEYAREELVDHVVTNPPIRAGKNTIQGFVTQAYRLLKPEGFVWVVIQKKQGAPSMQKFMEELFGNVDKINQDKGYWILRSKKTSLNEK